MKDLNRVKCIYFKINNDKNELKVASQIKKIIERLKTRYKIQKNSIQIKFGYVNDDFINNRYRVRITFKIEKQ